MRLKKVLTWALIGTLISTPVMSVNLTWAKQSQINQKNVLKVEKSHIKKKNVFTKKTETELDQLIKQEDKLSKKFTKAEFETLVKNICKLNETMYARDMDYKISNPCDIERMDKMDYVLYKMTELAYFNTKGKERNQLFSDMVDTLYQSAEKRYNNGKVSTLFVDLGNYYTVDMKGAFDDKKTIGTLARFQSYIDRVARAGFIDDIGMSIDKVHSKLPSVSK